MTEAPLIVPVSTTRRPMPILAYTAALIMAVLYISDIATAKALASAADSAVATLWQWCLLAGAALALTGVALPRTRYRVALPTESFGATMVAITVAIYVVTVWTNSTGDNPPWATIVWIGVIVPSGLAWRAVEAIRQRGALVEVNAEKAP